jgi:hypothetical protein
MSTHPETESLVGSGTPAASELRGRREGARIRSLPAVGQQEHARAAIRGLIEFQLASTEMRRLLARDAELRLSWYWFNTTCQLFATHPEEMHALAQEAGLLSDHYPMGVIDSVFDLLMSFREAAEEANT